MECKNEYEKKYTKEGYTKILGIDEAGRGPLAGPLVVAGVCFPKGYAHAEIYDSKKISEKKREELFDVIKNDAQYYDIIIVDIEEIDKLNIYQATKKAMMQIANDAEDIEVVLSDAMPFTLSNMIVEPIVKGDQKSVSIAAASILAKVTRDRIMNMYDEKYPEYGFKNHKGYPTKQHLAALEKYGVLDIHRKSYGPVARLRQLKFDI
ncbi:ribonuclease HII [Breznakia sp. PF5-3]|uniref:ribonuclease HII n=1 Tax=unclassified Breznakia TaxID=2623764 RepID=UPI002405396F|nr:MULTISPECIES: ribonuclease HII [unclassified Breznakia]MDL2276820.1 ribonuclease HII [Breznakia sp. OttesenSCG-928-G09]MDF9824391.1 ribonuclease HII [Breznakia sp. PM6-1]MDF9835120.1 ribonuclease HII [Breznakia sp. PF5-3]MDF9838231.1 ribonuclease HII [Breznakia sp. PFB2-8]MDF9860246.1 ribonuclease HII [Breznakia sp. PH5-24]